jgi:hypothetical protein
LACTSHTFAERFQVAHSVVSNIFRFPRGGKRYIA